MTVQIIHRRTLPGGMRELVIGTSASGRNNAHSFDTIGYFTTVVAHRIIFDEVPTLNALIQEVKRQINDSMPYTDIPVDQENKDIKRL